MEMEDAFRRAVDFIQSLPSDGEYQPSIQEKLQFYALFKQATIGPNKTKKPSMLQLVAKTKWDAWKGLGKMTKEKAKAKYIEKFIGVASKIPDKDAQALVQELKGMKLSAKL